MSAWDESVFWPAFEAAGMLTEARVALPNCPVETVAMVDYSEPDVELLDGLSKQYQIEYQYADLPTLAEDTELVLALPSGDTLFRVRQCAKVAEEQNSGFFRRALLTKV